LTKRAWRYWEPTFLADKVCEMNPVWPWGGHRRFAYDLARWMRPTRIAELGVHWGTSFFTFAQAMKDGRMKDTELIGVDTFEGEDHAGKYGPEVLDTVRGIVKKHFPKQQITLHQMFFADALALVDDESVDLLHIDGLHTFEAVKDDFETWLPKLAPDGVMLFHDVAPDTGYGSTDFWNRLSKEHPGFAFEHSWGLGVLFPKGDARLRELEREGLADKLIAYPALAKAERSAIECRDLGRMAKERMETIQRQSDVHTELRERLAELRQSTVPKEALGKAVAQAAAAERVADQQRETVKALSVKVETRDKVAERQLVQLEAARKLAKERYEVIQGQSDKVRLRDETIGTLRKQHRAQSDLSARLEKRAGVAEAARDELRLRVQSQHELLAEQRERFKAVEQQIKAHAEQAARVREALAASNATVMRLQEQIKAAEDGRRALEASLAAQTAHLTDQTTCLADLTTHVAALASSHAKDRAVAAERFGELQDAIGKSKQASENAARAFRQRLNRLDVDAELQSLRAEHLEEIVANQREVLDRLKQQDHTEADWLTGERLG